MECRYITPEGQINLKNHKYSGSDEGIAYRFCYNPLANRLVERIPKTIAPNTITLVGFLHTLVPMLVFYLVAGNSLYGDVPRWWSFLHAWSFFAYRMLDEMDGKQARRTGNSSALGLLFDHGCDAFSVAF